MERLLWLKPPTSHFADISDIAGTYTALVNSEECRVRFWFGPNRVLRGTFAAEGGELEISGGRSERGGAIGFLLEPTSHAPIAVFRARLAEGGVLLEIDVPDFEELLELCSLERIQLRRVEDT